MAAEHAPLYRTIAEQVSAYIDIAVTDPVTGNWGPSWTGAEDELPMELLFDYDEPFPLPTGLDSILGIFEISDDHRTTMHQVLLDLLNMPNLRDFGVPYHIKELRLAYRSRMNSSLFTWDITRSTPFVDNYLLLARTEGALKRHRNNPRIHPNMMTEKPLPSYIGGRVHARLVEAKAGLNAIGFGHDLGLTCDSRPSYIKDPRYPNIGWIAVWTAPAVLFLRGSGKGAVQHLSLGRLGPGNTNPRNIIHIKQELRSGPPNSRGVQITDLAHRSTHVIDPPLPNWEARHSPLATLSSAHQRVRCLGGIRTFELPKRPASGCLFWTSVMWLKDSTRI
ncbi:hypothetical protein C8J57DRAFT_1213298 [Mycena rebaudengoi]|nr:hypothetical protein C8J57DRAFT_1213298 [Mycena rebaudengoi]